MSWSPSLAIENWYQSTPLELSPLMDPPSAVSWTRRSAHASIAAGFDLVLLRGDGLVGGPPCGILLGNKDVIRRIIAHPLFAAWKLDPSRSAALTAMLECYDNPTRGIDSIPVWQCLTCFDRQSPQPGRADGTATRPMPRQSHRPHRSKRTSPISAALPDGLPSYGIALLPRENRDANGLDNSFNRPAFPILGRVEDRRIILDLRTVLPRQDRILVESLTNRRCTGNVTTSQRSHPNSRDPKGSPGFGGRQSLDLAASRSSSQINVVRSGPSQPSGQHRPSKSCRACPKFAGRDKIELSRYYRST